jgi:hypothetical protein
MLELTASSGAVRFRLKVVPGASRTRIVGEMEGALKVAVSAPPEKGKANRAVLALLAEALGVKARQLRIESGAGSTYKRCLVSGTTIEQVQAALEEAGKSPKTGGQG